MKNRWGIVLALLAVLSTACEPRPGPGYFEEAPTSSLQDLSSMTADDLAPMEARWEEIGMLAYEITWEFRHTGGRGLVGTQNDYSILWRVQDGETVSCKSTPIDEGTLDGCPQYPETLPGTSPVRVLFSAASGRDPSHMTVEFDPEFFFPTYIAYDDAALADEEWEIDVVDFTALGP